MPPVLHAHLARQHDLVELARADPLHRAPDGVLVVRRGGSARHTRAGGGARVEQRHRRGAQVAPGARRTRSSASAPLPSEPSTATVTVRRAWSPCARATARASPAVPGRSRPTPAWLPRRRRTRSRRRTPDRHRAGGPGPWRGRPPSSVRRSGGNPRRHASNRSRPERVTAIACPSAAHRVAVATGLLEAEEALTLLADGQNRGRQVQLGPIGTVTEAKVRRARRRARRSASSTRRASRSRAL